MQQVSCATETTAFASDTSPLGFDFFAWEEHHHHHPHHHHQQQQQHNRLTTDQLTSDSNNNNDDDDDAENCSGDYREIS